MPSLSLPQKIAIATISVAAVGCSLAVNVQDGLTRVRLQPNYADPDLAARVFRFARRSGTLADWPDGAIARIVEGNHTSELSAASRSALMTGAIPTEWPGK